MDSRIPCQKQHLEGWQDCKPTAHLCPICDNQLRAHFKGASQRLLIIHCNDCTYRFTQPEKTTERTPAKNEPEINIGL